MSRADCISADIGVACFPAEYLRWLCRIGPANRRAIECGSCIAYFDTLERRFVIGPMPRRLLPPCGARTRAGHPCKRRVVPGKARCSNHGGLSTGPRTLEGRVRISASNRRRALLRRLAQRAETQPLSAPNQAHPPGHTP